MGKTSDARVARTPRFARGKQQPRDPSMAPNVNLLLTLFDQQFTPSNSVRPRTRSNIFPKNSQNSEKFFPLTPAPLPSTPKNCLTSSQARIVRKWNWWTFDILWWKQLWDFPGQEMALMAKYPNLFSWNIWKWKWSRCLFYLQMSSSAVENVRINKPPVAAWWRHSRLATGHLMKSGPATFRSAPFQSCFSLNYESISYKTKCLRSFRVKYLKCTAAFWIFVEIEK